MMVVPAYVSCSQSSGFVTSLYALTQFNTNELTLSDHRLPFLSNFFKFQQHSAYVLLHFYLRRRTNRNERVVGGP